MSNSNAYLTYTLDTATTCCGHYYTAMNTMLSMQS